MKSARLLVEMMGETELGSQGISGEGHTFPLQPADSVISGSMFSRQGKDVKSLTKERGLTRRPALCGSAPQYELLSSGSSAPQLDR